MRIGLNLLYLIPEVVGGTETYARSLIQALAGLDSGDQFFVFVNAESREWDLPEHRSVTRVVCPVKASRRPLRHLWEQVVLPLRARHFRLDVLHSLAYAGPILAPCPSVVTIHDANYWRLREGVPLMRRMAASRLCRGAAESARRIIAVSNFAKREIVERLHVDPRKIAVIYEGAEPANGPGESERWPELRRRYKLPGPFLLAFGSGENRHKNMSRLIEAFSAACRDMPHCLVLAGRVPEGIDVSAVQRDRVRVVGYIPRAHLLAMLRHTELFVMPSIYEGFGLPVIEAQSAGAPVACSRAAALPEVAGDGAQYFDPLSVTEMADTIRQCLLNERLRAKLKDSGTRNVTRFSWKAAAEKTLDLYREAAAPN